MEGRIAKFFYVRTFITAKLIATQVLRILCSAFMIPMINLCRRNAKIV